MHQPKCDDLDYIQFLIAAQKVFSCTEAARCQPQDNDQAPAHDAFTRLLSRRPPDTEALWQEAQALVAPETGLLILDDTTLDKPHARHMELVTRHWSGKHRRVVSGINLLTLLWTDGHLHASGHQASVPCDCRVYDKPLEQGQTKNQHFCDLITTAKARGFAPRFVCFDSWYSSLDNLKVIRNCQEPEEPDAWHWFTRLKHNCQVNPDGAGNVAVDAIDIPAHGRQVHLKGYGFIKVFRSVAPNGDAEFWATSDLALTHAQRQTLERQCFAIENYHRGLKQCCGVERAQVRKAAAQKYHILLSLRAFVRLEAHRLHTGRSWYETKTAIIRDAIRQYLARPNVLLVTTIKPTA